MRTKTEQKHPLFLFVVLSATVLLVGLGLFVHGRISAVQAQAGADGVQAVATPVRAAKVECRVVLAEARINGFLKPMTEITVSAQVPGEIVRQWVDVSDEVKAGEPLFKIDEVVHDLDRQMAEATQRRAESERKFAQANWDRIKALPENVTTSIERIEAETRFLAAEAGLRGAEVAVRRAGVLVERTTIASPIDGVVSRILTRQGEFTHQGQPLAQMIEVGQLKLLAQVEDHDVVWVKVGQSATLSTNTLPGEAFTAKVKRIYPLAFPTSRKFEVELELPNPNHRLRPGFFMSGTITEGAPDSAPQGDSARMLIVPRESVVDRYGQKYCYVIHTPEEDGGADSIFEARRTAVEVLPLLSDPRSYQLVSGVAEGSLVVTKGHQHLSESSFVRITD